MLNCTDLACVLHHHHFYAHLHHLKHHLDDHHSPHDHHHEQGTGDGGDVDSSDVQGLLNDTDSELSSLSHLDAPNDVIYMVCGVLIAMLLVGLIIVLVAVTINKLRKRDDHGVSQTDVETAPQVLPTTETTANNNHSNNNNNNTPIAYRQNPSSVWVFPPLPPQPNLYLHNAGSQIALMQNDKGGYRGFKKQLSGRFKRLVNRKPQEPSPCIPPELKPQLKSIYVY